MSRYIDADALIKNMRGCFIDNIEENIAVQIINSASSIDIVRCGECKKTKDLFKSIDEAVWCDKWKYVMSADDFCSRGERREP